MAPQPTSVVVDNAAPSARYAELDLTESMELGRLAFLPTPRGGFESGSTTWYSEVTTRSFYVTPAASVGEPMPGGVSFETTALQRGAWAWPTDRAFAPDARGGMTRRAGDASEWLRGRDGGLEQGWTFDTKPNGGGDLVVRVNASDADFLHADEAGLHFEGDAGNVVYGHGTWIDGTGERTAVAASWTRGAIELVVPAELVEQSAYPATLDPVIGPEMETDPAAVGPDDTGVSGGPRVACTATMCIALWKHSTGLSWVRFTPDGTVIGFPIQITSDTTSVVAGVGAMSDRFMLLWQTGPVGPVFGAEFLHTQIVGEDGTPQGAPSTLVGPIEIHTYFGANPVGMACAPDRCMIAWAQQPEAVTTSKRVDASGTVLDPFGTLLGGANGSLTLAFDGTNFVVGKASGVRRFTLGGLPVDAGEIPVMDTDVMGLASDGVSSLAVGAGRARRINPNGSLGPLVTLPQSLVGVSWTGSTYLAIHDDLTGQRLDLDGNPIGAAVVYGATGVAPTITSRVIAARSSSSDAVIRTVDTNGVPTAGLVPLNIGTNPERRPAVVAGDNQYLVLWAGRRLGTHGAYAQRYSAAGVALDAVPFVVANGFVGSVAGAFDGTNYLVAGAWGGQTRVSTAGAVLDGLVGGISVRFDPKHVGVSWDGTTFAVSRSGEYGDVYVQLVTTTGLVLGGTATVVTSGVAASDLSVTSDNTSHIITWVINGTGGMRRYTSGGTFTAPFSSLGPLPDGRISVDCSPVVCLVYGGSTLRTLGGTSLALPAGGPGSPLDPNAITHAGNEFLLVGSGADVLGLRLNSAAMPAALGGWFNISQSPTSDEVASAAAALGDGSALVAYERRIPAENANRIFLRGIILASPNGNVCSLTSDCQSGICVDGVCCDTACGGGAADCQACSIAAGASTNGTCGPIVAGTECRASAGTCDVAEACDGSSPTCPVNGFAAATTECRASGGDCDEAETCTGASATCPIDKFLPSTTQCRASSDVCDVAEDCTGAAATCPNDAVASSATVCRAADGDCDVAENCNGTATACPVDGFAPSTTTCRAADGLCDAEETCSGSGADCPTDEVAPAGTSCREANGDCDVEDFCDGASTDCENEGEPANTPCGPAPMGDCDAQDTCEGGPGNTNSCTDWVLDETNTCRESAGPCDVEEKCALAYDCPDDDFASGAVCREAATECDIEEACNGSSAECPDDTFRPEGLPCDDGVCASGECVPEGSGGSGSGGSGNGGGPAGGSSSGNDGDGDGSESGGDGCSCNAAGTSPSVALWPLSLALVASLARRRRGQRVPASRTLPSPRVGTPPARTPR